MNIIVLGHVCIDTNTSEHSSYVTAGSSGMFMDKIFQHFPDTKTRLITPYGKDFFPFKGSTVLIPHQPTAKKTLLYENITIHSIRKQKAYNRQYAKPIPLTATVQKLLASADILFIAPLLPNYSAPYLRSVLAHTNAHAMKILLPQGYYRSFDRYDRVTNRKFEEASAILPFMDIVIVSDKDHINIKKEATIWTHTYPHLIAIMTMAKKGALVLQNKKKIMLPTTPVPQKDIVDSVGSGDIFSAGFAYRYTQTKNIKAAGAFANALARQCLFYTPQTIAFDYPSLP